MNAQLRDLTIFALAFPILMGPGDCQEIPPCSEFPMSLTGDFDGVLYDESVGGQALSTSTSYCVNIYGDITHLTNPNNVQTVVLEERVQGQDLLYIFVANFETPNNWDGGAQFVVKSSAVESAATSGLPIPIDGLSAQAFIWENNYWDGEAEPNFQTVTGELYFDSAVLVAGGNVEAHYDGMLENYVPLTTLSPMRLPSFAELP